MKNKWTIIIGVSTLVFPLLVILLVYLICEINIFDNPDFWYGYMAYFGTISLAAVALWQNENANRTNKRIMIQQLRQKIGYFNLMEATGERRKINKYKDVCIQDKNVNKENNAIEEYLIIDLQNVGEDLVLNPKVISSTINGCPAKLITEIPAIYINETIGFHLESSNIKDDVLKVDFRIEMQNTAGIYYTQSFNIELKKLNTDDPVTFIIRRFNTSIEFKEDSANG